MNASISPPEKITWGALLLNMGGPQTLDAIQPYLEELFSDPMIIRLPWGTCFQKTLARFIAKRRAPIARERYELIGGHSPLHSETEALIQQLRSQVPIPVEFAMRYTPPRAAEVLAHLKKRGITRLMAIPLYPQFSTATTASSLAELQHLNILPIVPVPNHYTHPGFIAALADQLQHTLTRINPREPTHILFTAHSLPIKTIQRGDPYVQQVRETVSLLTQKVALPHPHSIAYQSRLGPVKWQGPSLEAELARISATHVKQIVVQPVSFVSENLETRYDLDLVFQNTCREHGIHSFFRVPVPGTSNLYVNTLADIINSIMTSNERTHHHD